MAWVVIIDRAGKMGKARRGSFVLPREVTALIKFEGLELGDADDRVPVDQSRTIIDLLKKAGGMPKYTEYPKVGHNSWDKAYAEKEFFTWLLEQKKK